MTTKLRTLIDEAWELSPPEQLNLIRTISQSLHRAYRQTQLETDFLEPKTLEQLIQAQQTQPITNIADLGVNFWPRDESADDFIEYIYQQRREDRMENG